MKNTLQTARSQFRDALKANLVELENQGQTLKAEFDAKMQNLKVEHDAIQQELDDLGTETTPKKKATAVAKVAKAKAVKKVVKTKKVAKKKAVKKATKKVAAKAAPKKKIAKKAIKKKVAAKKKGRGKGKKNSAKNIAAATKGRRAVASGERPPLKEAIATVMGSKTLGASQVIAALTAKEWLPDSDNQQSYISYALSNNKDVFERVSRGLYRLRNANINVAPKKKVAATAVASEPKTVDENKLDDLGIKKNGNVEPNIFAGV